MLGLSKYFSLLVAILLLVGCQKKELTMAELIKKTAEEQFFVHQNFYGASQRVVHYDSLLKTAPENQIDRYNLEKADALLYAGQTRGAIECKCQNENNWLSIRLEGATSNRSAIGSKIEVTTMVNGEKRTFYHTISSGGSFGCSTLRAEIGLGQSTEIVQVKVIWAGSLTEQVFNNMELNTFYKLVESKQPEKLNLNPLNL